MILVIPRQSIPVQHRQFEAIMLLHNAGHPVPQLGEFIWNDARKCAIKNLDQLMAEYKPDWLTQWKANKPATSEGGAAAAAAAVPVNEQEIAANKRAKTVAGEVQHQLDHLVAAAAAGADKPAEREEEAATAAAENHAAAAAQQNHATAAGAAAGAAATAASPAAAAVAHTGSPHFTRRSAAAAGFAHVNPHLSKAYHAKADADTAP
jgi:hypothetical protein